jgi:hypothetical protein
MMSQYAAPELHISADGFHDIDGAFADIEDAGFFGSTEPRIADVDADLEYSINMVWG